MDKTQWLQWLKQRQRSLLVGGGLLVLAGGVLGAQVYRPIASKAPPPAATSTSTEVTGSFVVPESSPAASPSPVPSPATKDGKPILSEAQRQLNQQAKARFQSSSATVDTFVEMQVAIAEGVSAVRVTILGDTRLTDKAGQLQRQLTKGQAFTVSPAGAGVQVGAQRLSEIVWLDPGLDGLVQVGDRTYRGILLLTVDARGRLWVVNYINLRQYLYSVVGSEVYHDWDMAALKAQAVAARSYALTYYFKPMSPLFHLGATEYYQVYKGIESENPRIKAAVDETAGQYVSYKGGVVESLYAASDDIVAEAFQGQGMSQLGARDLANQGYSYERILQHYYPGTKLGRIKKYHE